MSRSPGQQSLPGGTGHLGQLQAQLLRKLEGRARGWDPSDLPTSAAAHATYAFSDYAKRVTLELGR